MPTAEREVTKAYLLADKKQGKLTVEQTEDGVTIKLPGHAPDPIASVVVIEHQ